METKKDLILRQIQQLSEFLNALTKQKKVDVDDVSVFIDEFLVTNYDLTLAQLLEKESDKIIELIEDDDIENIQDFANILYLRYNQETVVDIKKKLSNAIISLYKAYQIKSNIYSFEIQSRINRLLVS